MYHEYFGNRTDVHTLYQIQDMHIIRATLHSVLLSFSKNYKQIYRCS